jgi:hypothetical protein
MGAFAKVRKGEENYEHYHSSFDDKIRVQYDYRHTDGELFSCIAKTLEQAKEKRNAWLREKLGTCVLSIPAHLQ